MASPGAGASGAQAAQTRHLFPDEGDGAVDLLLAGAAAYAEAQRALRELVVPPQRTQHVRGLARRGGAGRAARHRKLAQGEEQALAFDALEAHVQDPGDAALRVAVQQHTPERAQALPES